MAKSHQLSKYILFCCRISFQETILRNKQFSFAERRTKNYRMTSILNKCNVETHTNKLKIPTPELAYIEV